MTVEVSVGDACPRGDSQYGVSTPVVSPTVLSIFQRKARKDDAASAVGIETT